MQHPSLCLVIKATRVKTISNAVWYLHWTEFKMVQWQWAVVIKKRQTRLLKKSKYVHQIHHYLMSACIRISCDFTITSIYPVSKIAPNLASCNFDKHRLILIIFSKQHRHTFKNDVVIQFLLIPSFLLTLFHFK